MTALPLFRHPNAVQVKVTLDGIEPPIWHRLAVPIGFHLGHLHLVVQAAFNWWNYHLHEFRIGGLSYGAHGQVGEPEFDDDRRFLDEAEVRLRDFDHWSGRRFLYLYDFGDGWRHTVELEKPLVLDPAPPRASCLDGARARPPEDVGGPPGYEAFLEVMADRRHPEHVETRRWCGGHFDPEWFDLDLVGKDVRRALKPNVRRRLHQPRPRRSATPMP
ncbi:MAG TPA: plasmid pRiA4b ORF-3 family protein [Arthrobacter sp.]|nr:plasmid pRiA4b ORF-3 family protein [Arthrobacter sp.]